MRTAPLLRCAGAALAAVLAAALLGGCGQKGPLYLPNRHKVTVPPATASTARAHATPHRAATAPPSPP